MALYEMLQLISNPLLWEIILDKLYTLIVLSVWTTFHDVTHPPALSESPRGKYTIFVLSIHPRAEALGWILKIKWCIHPQTIQNRAGTLSTCSVLMSSLHFTINLKDYKWELSKDTFSHAILLTNIHLREMTNENFQNILHFLMQFFSQIYT
jgi:hypothetical protein